MTTSLERVHPTRRARDLVRESSNRELERGSGEHSVEHRLEALGNAVDARAAEIDEAHHEHRVRRDTIGVGITRMSKGICGTPTPWWERRARVTLGSMREEHPGEQPPPPAATDQAGDEDLASTRPTVDEMSEWSFPASDPPATWTWDVERPSRG
jgi:hypothetical protein